MLVMILSRMPRVVIKYGQWSWTMRVDKSTHAALVSIAKGLGARWSLHGGTELLMMRYSPTGVEAMNDADEYCSCSNPNWIGTIATGGSWVCDGCGLPHE